MGCEGQGDRAGQFDRRRGGGAAQAEPGDHNGDARPVRGLIRGPRIGQPDRFRRRLGGIDQRLGRGLGNRRDAGRNHRIVGLGRRFPGSLPGGARELLLARHGHDLVGREGSDGVRHRLLVIGENRQRRHQNRPYRGIPGGFRADPRTGDQRRCCLGNRLRLYLGSLHGGNGDFRLDRRRCCLGNRFRRNLGSLHGGDGDFRLGFRLDRGRRCLGHRFRRHLGSLHGGNGDFRLGFRLDQQRRCLGNRFRLHLGSVHGGDGDFRLGFDRRRRGLGNRRLFDHRRGEIEGRREGRRRQPHGEQDDRSRRLPQRPKGDRSLRRGRRRQGDKYPADQGGEKQHQRHPGGGVRAGPL